MKNLKTIIENGYAFVYDKETGFIDVYNYADNTIQEWVTELSISSKSELKNTIKEYAKKQSNLIKSYEILYKDGEHEIVTPEMLEAIRIGTLTFIYDKDINTCLVFFGEDNLEYLNEFKTDIFTREDCIEFMKENINVRKIEH
ncbi:hypothetical protein [Peptostreptococcus faecalis]|uniref:hypothetical protein n=1 Tax=Peptostreptococcus faecalis TaxID=2045015 RepID=UPI000C7CD709|nr:hypothetical protein [Peptostreptococcus faecalis]